MEQSSGENGEINEQLQYQIDLFKNIFTEFLGGKIQRGCELWISGFK